MAAVPEAYKAPLARYGPLADDEARKYGLTGSELLAKLLSGESGFNMGSVSSAGARGAAQFIPGTRQDYISRYGVDPWASPDSAVHAAALYMQKGGGLAAYNRGGGQGYINYILGQNVGGVPKGDPNAKTQPQLTSGVPGAGGGGLFDSVRGAAVTALLWIALVGVGAFLAFRGTSKLVGVQPGLTAGASA
jgi:membrane-bound lytic murein transglycosylase B